MLGSQYKSVNFGSIRASQEAVGGGHLRARCSGPWGSGRHRTPYTLHATPYNHPVPYTLHLANTLHPPPYTCAPVAAGLGGMGATLHTTPYTLHPEYTLHHTLYTCAFMLASRFYWCFRFQVKSVPCTFTFE